ncbi:MAG: type III PLP-dependent enzyme [Pseudomonadota bacterium]
MNLPFQPHAVANLPSKFADTAALLAHTTPGEPLYLFCAARLVARAQLFRALFPGTTSYAVKANPESEVLRTLVGQGIRHFDVASITEIRHVLEVCPDASLHYNNPVKDQSALREAYEMRGLRSFALDDHAEFDKIHRVTQGDSEVTFTVRFKLTHRDAAYDFGSKFGADIDTAAALLSRVRSAGGRPALTFHPGSQCSDPEVYVEYLQAAARIAKLAGVEPEFINVGGGFPVQYPDEKAPPLATYFELIRQTAKRYFSGDIGLMCEPGRAMVADCVSLLARVIHIRDCGSRVFLNDGVYGSFQEQSFTRFLVPSCVWRDSQRLGGREKPFQVFGPTCDPIDRMQRDIKWPAALREGDYIEFGLLGAYGSATATCFNGFHAGDYVRINKGTDFMQEKKA